MKKLFLIFSLFLISHSSYSQNYDWWNTKHNWDGITHWSEYIIISPAYMGPNAIPVPKLKNGNLQENISFELATEYHHNNGDKTYNLFTELFLPIVKNKVALNINVVPVEYYKLDTITRDKRRSREYNPEGFAGGDFYISTLIQLLTEKNILPDALLSINIKTASGTNLGGARYTESPGYFFDLALGKTIIENRQKLNFIKIYGQLGFYSFQTNKRDYYQNDAFTYGLGLELNFKRFIIKNNFSGYYGYINNGDRPLVYRFIIQNQNSKFVNYKFMLQHGINDFDYTTIRIATTFNLSNLLTKKEM